MASIFKDRIFRISGGDLSLWIIVGVLMAISVVVVFSSIGSLAYNTSGGETTSYLVSQVRYVLISFSVMFIVHLGDYKVYKRFSYFIFICSILLLLYAYVDGVEINGEKRWLRILGFTFQPADILKIGVMMVLSLQLSGRQREIANSKIIPDLLPRAWRGEGAAEKQISIIVRNTIPIILPIVITSALVLITNLSTAIIIFVACFFMLYIARVRLVELGKLIVVAVVGFLLILCFMKVFGVGRADTWINRIESFVSSDDGDSESDMQKKFQEQQAKITVASGWLLGKGPGQSTQRSNLPHPYSDYAYAFIIEEYGFLGGLLVLFMYLFIFYRAVMIFIRSNHSYAVFLVLGLTMIITIQALFHIGVSVSIFPVTGQPLPIISKGGSSLLFTSVMFGMILGISRQTNEEKRARDEQVARELIEDLDQIIIEEHLGVDEDGQEVVLNRFFEDDEAPTHAGILWNRIEEDEDDKDNS